MTTVSRWVEGAGVGRKEQHLESFSIKIVELLGIVNLQVVKDEQHSPPIALLLESNEEVLEVVRIVALINNMVMDQASAFADAPDC